MSIAIEQTIQALQVVLQEVPAGTNLALLQLLWSMLNLGSSPLSPAYLDLWVITRMVLLTCFWAFGYTVLGNGSHFRGQASREKTLILKVYKAYFPRLSSTTFTRRLIGWIIKVVFTGPQKHLFRWAAI
jgi:hypothetical protein